MQLEVGSIIEGKVVGITKFGAFIELPGGKTGMVHISEIAQTYVTEIRDHITNDQIVKVKVLNIGEDGKVSLSIKSATELTANQKGAVKPGVAEWKSNRQEPSSFEDMLTKFKQVSEERISDLKKTRESKRGGYQRRGGSQFKY